MRCTSREHYFPRPPVLKLTLRFLSFTLQFYLSFFWFDFNSGLVLLPSCGYRAVRTWWYDPLPSTLFSTYCLFVCYVHEDALVTSIDGLLIDGIITHPLVHHSHWTFYHVYGAASRTNKLTWIDWIYGVLWSRNRDSKLTRLARAPYCDVLRHCALQLRVHCSVNLLAVAMSHWSATFCY